ncbi:MAG TPA: START domain-containing protein [Chitinophagaceae bacterium]|nr:START domain-containing protein [Chitinophagaceae bacterium]
MKFFAKISWAVLFCSVVSTAFSQYKWKLSKDKDGIKVYLAENPKSKFKSIKDECTLAGNFDKLIAVLTDIEHLKDWVYNTKMSYLIKKITAYDLYYYTETSIPWPMSNRDAVVHLRILKDSAQNFMKISSTNENRLVPEKDGKVRVIYSLINWYVTMPTSRTISIVYTFEADPGGSLPAWLVNSFADKGPYESFRKLSEILRTR